MKIKLHKNKNQNMRGGRARKNRKKFYKTQTHERKLKNVCDQKNTKK